MTATRRLAAAGAALGLTALLLTAASTGPSVAAPVSVTPDVASLGAGAYPHLPYVNLATKRIVDGTRRVSISGIQGTVTALHKVDGGYLLARNVTGGADLVMVTHSGDRRVLVAHWMQAPTEYLDPGLAVSHDGSKLAVNVSTAGDATTYRETRVVALPSGTTLHSKVFDYGVKLLGYGTQRVLVGDYPGSRWWTPSSGAAPVLSADRMGQTADLTAWQWATRSPVAAYAVQGIPPDTSPNWPVAEEDIQLGPWSLDDTRIAGNNEVTDNSESSAYLVYRTSDGARLLSVLVPGHPQITWESNSALLMATRVGETGRHQLIRCTLAGACSRVGPESTSRYGAVIPATRRNS